MSAIKKVVIFGSTGNTGLATVAKALEKGLTVTAFLRDPSKLPADCKVDKVVKGDVTNQADVDAAVRDQDAVIIALGTRNDLSATTTMSTGTQNIVDSMKKFGVNRVSCCLSSFLFWDQDKIPAQMANIHEEHKKMLTILQSSDREWIVLCPPHIDDKPGSKPYKMEKEARVGPVISKFDLGDSLVSTLLTDEYLKCRVGLGY
ncbi:flavin reductase (NADPH) [Brevipalpus obovatus]|uniref:flavin reductase (NADPH) n=1 Tax=Brevipalpus obovatus TaxID=246614 RepID=UPI003D9F5D39